MGQFEKGFIKEDGTCEISVRGHSNAIHELVLPPEVMKMVNWKDGQRVEIVRQITVKEPNKQILGLSITKVDDAKLLDDSEADLPEGYTYSIKESEVE